ncbi:hypothetical protein ACRS5S_02450 [Nocardia asiatica]|uniref:hypothetical protein n=1 Tax=Nocardia asiatica TaxID=209252 RepID=UPI003EE24118
MTVRRYYVDVHCCGPRWLIHVPALDRWTVTGDKSAIRSTARRMIAATTGHDDHSFELDLAAGRALRDAEEFAVGHRVPTRWHPPDEPGGRAPPCTTSRGPPPTATHFHALSGFSPARSATDQKRVVRRDAEPRPTTTSAMPVSRSATDRHRSEAGSCALTPHRHRRQYRRCR